MSNVVIGIMLGLGVGAWVFAKMQRSTGNNTRTAIIVGFVAGLFAMIAIMVALQTFFKKN